MNKAKIEATLLKEILRVWRKDDCCCFITSDDDCGLVPAVKEYVKLIEEEDKQMRSGGAMANTNVNDHDDCYQCNECVKMRWPEKLTPELNDALGEMVFRTGPVAHAYRDAGFDIPRKIEAEQAFVLHKFVGLALQHGAGWRKVFAVELDKVIAKAKERLAANR